MKIGSLFTGIGGLDLGLERAGGDVKWQVEIDRHATRVLERHWPNVKRYTDITTINVRDLERVDIICGGFPCQDLSVAGNRKGLAGERSGLFFKFMRVVRGLTPEWILIENVPGLLSSNEGRDMATVVSEMADLGYGWAYRVLDSQYFGVPQRRRRVFIIGRLGKPCPPEILFEPESVYGDTTPGGSTGEDVARVIATVSNAQRYDGETKTFIVRRAQTGSNGWGVSEEVTHTLDETGGDAVLHYLEDWQQNGGEAVSGLVNVGQVRRLTPTECERLQGFPAGWTGDQADAQRYKQLGNAVTVPVAEWIGRRLVKGAA